MVVVNFRVPADVKARAASRAEREGFSLSDVLRQFLITWADREGPPA